MDDYNTVLARVDARDVEITNLRAELAADFIVEDYFYVSGVEFSISASTWHCFPQFAVNANEVLEFKANLDGYWGLNPSIHYDLKLEKDLVEVVAGSSIEDDTTDILGLRYSG